MSTVKERIKKVAPFTYGLMNNNDVNVLQFLQENLYHKRGDRYDSNMPKTDVELSDQEIDDYSSVFSILDNDDKLPLSDGFISSKYEKILAKYNVTDFAVLVGIIESNLKLLTSFKGLGINGVADIILQVYNELEIILINGFSDDDESFKSVVENTDDVQIIHEEPGTDTIDDEDDYCQDCPCPCTNCGDDTDGDPEECQCTEEKPKKVGFFRRLFGLK
jgi:hypothetical protein